MNTNLFEFEYTIFNPINLLILFSIILFFITIYTIYHTDDDEIIKMREIIYPLSGDCIDYRALQEIIIENEEENRKKK